MRCIALHQLEIGAVVLIAALFRDTKSSVFFFLYIPEPILDVILIRQKKINLFSICAGQQQAHAANYIYI